MLTVSGKAIGRKRPLFADFSVPLPPELAGGGGVTLRDLISRVVRHEVAAFRARQSDRQMLHALTARQIEAAAERGKIASGQSEVAPQEVDEEAAIGTALVAFEDGLFLTVLDGEELHSLDAQVFPRDDSHLTFVRLTLLAGG